MNHVSLHMMTSCNKSGMGGRRTTGCIDAMVVQLGVVCTGTVRVKETLNKVDEIVHAGKTHNQYNTIFSCRVKVMKERTVQKRQARRAVLDDDIGAISEEDGTDGDDDDDEEMLGAVGSGRVGL